MTKIRIEGMDRALRDLNRIETGIRRNIPDWMRQGVLYIQSRIPPYPAPPPSSSYRRTGTLGRVITAFGGGSFSGDAQPLARVEILGSKVVGYVGGRLSYINEVIGEGEQAGVHRGRWYTLQQVVRDNIGGVVRIFEDGIRGLIR